MRAFCKHCQRNVELMEVGFRKAFYEQNYKCSLCGNPVRPQKNQWIINILVICGIVTLILIALSSATISITPFSTNPSNGSTVNTRYVNLGWNITTNETLSSIIFNWNNTNYSLYDNSIVLYYNFDNRSSLGENDTVVKDISRYVNNASVIGGNNISWNSSGKYGGAFASTGDFAYINTSTTLNSTFNTKQFTTSFWIKFRNSSNFRSIWHTGNMRLEVSPSNKKLSLTLVNATDSVNVNPTIGYTVYDGTESAWYNIVVTYNGTTISFYSNGALNQAFPSLNGNLNGTTSSFKLFGNGVSTTSNITLDDFIVYNRTLSPDEINNSYYSQLTKYGLNNWSMSRFNQSKVVVNPTSFGVFVTDLFSSNTSSVSNVRLLNTINFQTSVVGIEKLFNYGTNTGGKYLAGDMLTYGTNCSDVSGNPIGYCNVTQNREVWGNSKMTIRRMVIDLDAYYSNQSVLTNGVNLTKNITQIQQDIAWANSRGDKILLGIYRVPTAYANVTSQCWSDNRSCMPNNFTIYNNIILDLINQSTSSGTYLNTIYALEIGNEYDSASFFLNNLTNVNANTPNRTLLYQQLYRNIYYAVKAQYPSLRIGGYASLAYQQYSNDFWENNSKALYNITDFFSIHPYWYDVIGTSYSSYVNLKYNQVCSNFTALEGYCPEVILSEFGVDNSSITNDTANINLYQSMISQAIDTLLNINPSNITFINYQFTHTNWILSEARWQMFSPSNMQNRFYGLYNVYANHTRYAPSGATVYNTSIDNNEIIGVSTKTGSTCSMIITNSVNDYQNATVNFDSSCGKQLIDVETGQMITSGQQITQAPSDISYLTTPTVVYNGSQAILVNYLNEKIRDATTGEFSSGESQRQGFCSTALSGYTGFTSQITTMMIILGALIVLSVVVILVKVIQDEGSIDLASNGFISNLGDVKLFFGGILAIAMLLFVGVSVLGALCSM